MLAGAPFDALPAVELDDGFATSEARWAAGTAGAETAEGAEVGNAELAVDGAVIAAGIGVSAVSADILMARIVASDRRFS